MENNTSVRGEIVALKIGKKALFPKGERLTSSVRTMASQIGTDHNRTFSVEAKKGSQFITVKRLA